MRAMSPQPSALTRELHLGDVAGLRALGTVNDLELHCLALLERTEAVALNGRVVHEDVAASVSLDEPVTLGVVEPFDLACNTHRSSSCLLWRGSGAPPVNQLRRSLCRNKKKGRVCGLSLTAPGPPGVGEIILDFAPHAKSPAERL